MPAPVAKTAAPAPPPPAAPRPAPAPAKPAAPAMAKSAAPLSPKIAPQGEFNDIPAPEEPEYESEAPEAEEVAPDAATAQPEGQEGQPEGEAKADEPEKPEEGPEPEYEIKVDGEVQKKPLKEILKLAEKGSGAEKRWEEAKSIREAAKEVFGMLQPDKNPENALADLWRSHYGGDRKKSYDALVGMADRIITAAIEYESLHPAEKEARMLKADLEDSRRELQTRQKADAERQEQEKVAQEMESLATETKKILKGLSLPDDEDTLEGVWDVWESLNRADPSTTAEQAAQEYQRRLKYRDDKEKQKLLDSHYAELKGLPEEEVLKRLPEDVLQTILKATLAKNKADRRPTQRPQGNGAPPPEKPERPKRVASYNLFRD